MTDDACTLSEPKEIKDGISLCIHQIALTLQYNDSKPHDNEYKRQHRYHSHI